MIFTASGWHGCFVLYIYICINIYIWILHRQEASTITFLGGRDNDGVSIIFRGGDSWEAKDAKIESPRYLPGDCRFSEPAFFPSFSGIQRGMVQKNECYSSHRRFYWWCPASRRLRRRRGTERRLASNSSRIDKNLCIVYLLMAVLFRQSQVAGSATAQRSRFFVDTVPHCVLESKVHIIFFQCFSLFIFLAALQECRVFRFFTLGEGRI